MINAELIQPSPARCAYHRELKKLQTMQDRLASYQHFKTGQKVLYSGVTSHDRVVETQEAVITSIGYSISLLITSDDKPLSIPERASVSAGDLMSGEKMLTLYEKEWDN